MGNHLVLEDDAADDDGDGGAEIADEAEGGGCSSDVALLSGDVSSACDCQGMMRA